MTSFRLKLRLGELLADRLVGFWQEVEKSQKGGNFVNSFVQKLSLFKTSPVGVIPHILKLDLFEKASFFLSIRSYTPNTFPPGSESLFLL